MEKFNKYKYYLKCFSNGRLTIFVAGSAIGAAPPDWLKKSVKVEGRLQLPYAEIDEPFTAYYDPINGRSRVDYYDGMRYK